MHPTGVDIRKRGCEYSTPPLEEAFQATMGVDCHPFDNNSGRHLVPALEPATV